MNYRNSIQQIVRICKKALHVEERYYSPEQERKKKALAKGRQLRLKRKGYIFKCSTLKPSFFLPLFENDYIQQRILTEETYYEFDNLNYICKEWNNGVVSQTIRGGCVFDIGANIGNHTLFFYYECEIGKAICFEPVESTFNILKRNVEINNIAQHVTLVKSAVGADIGTAAISHYDASNIGSTQISLDESGVIPVVSIDSLGLEENVKLIKIDVEGAEKGVVDGCKMTLKKYKPYIMIEIQPENLEYITMVLSRIGYKYIQLTGINYFFYV